MIDKLIADIESSTHTIIYGKPKQWAINYYMIDIYNGGIDHPLQKYWFYVPRAKVLDINKNSIQLVLTNAEQDAKLVNYIESLENNIFNHIKKNFLATVKKINRSFSKNKLFPPVIKLDYNQDTIFFNESDDEATLSPSYLNQNDMVGTYLELNNILTSDNEVWIIWKILQLKKMEGVNLRKSFFKSSQPPPQPFAHMQSTFTPNIPPPPPCILPLPISNVPNVFIPKIEIKKTSVEPSPLTTTRSTSFMISESDIKSQIGRLRKVSKDKEEKVEEVNNDNIFKVEELKKVETKLPMETNEWYNSSVECETICNLLDNHNNDDPDIFILKIEKIAQMVDKKIKYINETYNDIVKIHIDANISN